MELLEEEEGEMKRGEKGRDSCNWLDKKREIERQERGRMGGTQQKN